MAGTLQPRGKAKLEDQLLDSQPRQKSKTDATQLGEVNYFDDFIRIVRNIMHEGNARILSQVYGFSNGQAKKGKVCGQVGAHRLTLLFKVVVLGYEKIMFFELLPNPLMVASSIGCEADFKMALKIAKQGDF